MVEVLIAGILLASALAAVSRLSVAALTSSTHLSERARIEADINENIQIMQKEDSYFTDTWILENEGQEGLQTACNNPAKALSNHLQTITTNPSSKQIKRTFDTESIPGILSIVYRFDGPEQQVKEEQRIIEMTPNFSAKCYSTK